MGFYITSFRTVYEFARTVITKDHKLDGLNNKNVWSQSFGGQKSKIEMLAGLVTAEACERESVLGLLLASGGLLAIPGRTSLHLCHRFYMAFSLWACLCPAFSF